MPPERCTAHCVSPRAGARGRRSGGFPSARFVVCRALARPAHESAPGAGGKTGSSSGPCVHLWRVTALAGQSADISTASCIKVADPGSFPMSSTIVRKSTNAGRVMPKVKAPLPMHKLPQLGLAVCVLLAGLACAPGAEDNAETQARETSLRQTEPETSTSTDTAQTTPSTSHRPEGAPSPTPAESIYANSANTASDACAVVRQTVDEYGIWEVPPEALDAMGRALSETPDLAPLAQAMHRFVELGTLPAGDMTEYYALSDAVADTCGVRRFLR